MKIFTATIIVASFLCGLAIVASSYSHTISKVKRGDGSPIYYYMESAKSGLKSDTLLVAFQGSDCNSVKHNDFIKDFSKGSWPSADLLLIEKPGITPSLPHDMSTERTDCPVYYLKNDNPIQRVQDARAVVSRVLEDRRYNNVIALGGSEGATVAAMFAAESRIPDVVVLINGGGRWFLEDVFHNIKSTTSEHQLSSELEGFKGFAEHILEAEPFDIEVSNHGYAWWRSMLTIDQQSVLSQINVPVLVVQGGRDKSVSPKAVTNMISGLQKAGKDNIELLAYPEMDHGLIAQDGQSMMQKVTGDIFLWLKTSLQPELNKSVH
ncbi:MAG: alpha/beta hydrolase family protein [Nitrincola lacisaponensis]|uniref:alpha/beta hydrolase family protein n=1 Tax=Nitrincola lacisaponensis TaxID=267850 RepID=UPI00391A14AA